MFTGCNKKNVLQIILQHINFSNIPYFQVLNIKKNQLQNGKKPNKVTGYLAKNKEKKSNFLHSF